MQIWSLADSSTSHSNHCRKSMMLLLQLLHGMLTKGWLVCLIKLLLCLLQELFTPDLCFLDRCSGHLWRFDHPLVNIPCDWWKNSMLLLVHLLHGMLTKGWPVCLSMLRCYLRGALTTRWQFSGRCSCDVWQSGCPFINIPSDRWRNSMMLLHHLSHGMLTKGSRVCLIKLLLCLLLELFTPESCFFDKCSRDLWQLHPLANIPCDWWRNSMLLLLHLLHGMLTKGWPVCLIIAWICLLHGMLTTQLCFSGRINCDIWQFGRPLVMRLTGAEGASRFFSDGHLGWWQWDCASLASAAVISSLYLFQRFLSLSRKRSWTGMYHLCVRAISIFFFLLPSYEGIAEHVTGHASSFIWQQEPLCACSLGG